MFSTTLDQIEERGVQKGLQKGLQKGIYKTALNMIRLGSDLVFVANGSEVNLLIDSAKELEKQGKSVRVVSAISEGLFNTQSSEYKKSIIPTITTPVMGYTAGLPDALTSIVGSLGKVYGREAFGASAPASVLDEKFGYTVKTVIKRVEMYLKEYSENISAIKAM